MITMKRLRYHKQLLFILLIVLSHTALSQSKSEQPVANFEKLWSDYNDRYAFFDIKNVDWDKMYEKYRPMINENTGNDSLFTVCCNMINELRDNHNHLVDRKNGRKCEGVKVNRLIEEFPTNRSLKLLLNTIDSTLNDNHFKELIRIKSEIPYLYGNIIEYTDNGNYGYLRINLMFGLSARKVDHLLDEIFESFSNVKGIILDVRFNSGGYDKISFEIAGRFVEERQIGHYKSRKTKSGFGEHEAVYLKPAGKTQFTKPVILLTSNQSMSATDVLALLLQDLPGVTIVGDNTMGIFSDIKEKKLPNGWRYTLSTFKYLASDGKNFEGTGIPPDIEILNSQDDIEKGIDPLVIKAIEVLNVLNTNK